MDVQAIKNAYRRYAFCYDYVFGKLLHPGRESAVRYINQHLPADARILEVGVGTGLSLPLYREDLTIVGIDVSREMLDKAKQRVEREDLRQVAALVEMDAENLKFPDCSFDAVVAMYVASVVPNLERFIHEITRVCVAGGAIIVVNHFTSENKFIRGIEQKLSAVHKALGWHPDFPIEPLVDHPRLELVNQFRTNLFGFWRLLHLRNITAEAGAAA